MAVSEKEQCDYIVRVKTGDRPDAGTDSTISLELDNPNNNGISVDDLREWGTMEDGHDYFEIDSLDIFRCQNPCINVCRIRISSDGKGTKKGWFLEYVEVTISRPRQKSTTKLFPVNQWLSRSEPPYQLDADVDNCAHLFIS